MTHLPLVDEQAQARRTGVQAQQRVAEQVGAVGGLLVAEAQFGHHLQLARTPGGEDLEVAVDVDAADHDLVPVPLPAQVREEVLEAVAGVAGHGAAVAVCEEQLLAHAVADGLCSSL